MKPLNGKIAIVAGSSRGAGRGIALALGEAGATVYVAARTSRKGPKPADGAPGTVEDTAEEVTARGGTGIPIRADLSDEKQVAALFSRVEKDHGRLDLLANSAWSANFMAVWHKHFWELDAAIWHETMETISVYWLTSVHAARIMTRHGGGLIIHVTDNLHPDTSAHRGQILHDLSHEFINRLVMDLSLAAKKSNIAVVGLNPGFMRTERVLMYMNSAARKKQFRFDLSETPEYIGRAAAALAADPGALKKTGQLLWACDLAKEYGLTDVDGRYIPRFDPKAPMQAFPC
ncbi:MAG TPA: SDR family NAD(P)-dependent oxidoreductase [Bryobacteraceae bacterium]|jgi:NAD(P)-dependent dehydrogenase (short-subunit alcohol dehydrogenase family)|nr:SDR family NAD(P)-dependent oxidoreductase [Bryobacteraceae bacterium]